MKKQTLLSFSIYLSNIFLILNKTPKYYIVFSYSSKKQQYEAIILLKWQIQSIFAQKH
jgi:hypothetical protein